MGALGQLLTDENSRNAELAPSSKQIITRDTRLSGFYRMDSATCSAYYCQADCKDQFDRKKTIRRKIEDVQLVDVDDARNEARLTIAKIIAGGFFDNGDKHHEVTPGRPGITSNRRASFPSKQCGRTGSQWRSCWLTFWMCH